MQLIIHLDPNIVASLENRNSSRSANHLVSQLKDLGVSITPLHADCDDDELKTHFAVAGIERMEQQELVNQLLRIDGVTAAYIKPNDFPPSF